jgi:archaellum component FlaC
MLVSSTEETGRAVARNGNGAMMTFLAFFSLLVSFIILVFVLNPGFIDLVLRGDIDALLSNEINIFFLMIIGIMIFSLATLVKTLGISNAIPLERIKGLRIGLRRSGRQREESGSREESVEQEAVLEIEQSSRAGVQEASESGEQQLGEGSGSSESGEQSRSSAESTSSEIGVDIDKKISDIVEKIRSELSQDTNRLASQIGSIMNDLKELSERVNSIENNIESLIIDVKTAVSELSNPFNYLRKFAEENELKDMGVDLSKYAPQQSSESGGRPAVATVEGQTTDGQPIQETTGRGNGSQQSTELDTQSTEGEASKEGIDLGSELRNILSSNLKVSQVMKLIVLFGELISSIDRSKVFDIIELGFSLNIIPNESKDIVASIIKILEETKAPPKTLALILYKLAKSLGVNDREADFLAIAYSGGDEVWQIRQ